MASLSATAPAWPSPSSALQRSTPQIKPGRISIWESRSKSFAESNASRPGGSRCDSPQLSPHLVFAGVHSGPRIPVGFAALLGLALVPVLFALGYGQLAFNAPIAEIE